MTAGALARQSQDVESARLASTAGERSPSATGAAAPLVSVENVSKRFMAEGSAVQALEDVSISLNSNDFFTLLGPSGCGKTTLLRLIAGFETADRGTVRLDGRDVGGDPPHKRPVNIVFQSYALFPHLTVAQNIAFGLERLGRPLRAIAERVEAMLRLVRLEETATRRPAQLSGGQQQRIALARALAPNPKLVLLDEPLSALDRKLRSGMQVELKRIQRETGIAFLLVTHDQEEALSLSDRIAVMNGGRVVQTGTPRDIYDAPSSRFVADFMGANVLPGRLLGRPEPLLAIRPERIRLSQNEGLSSLVRETTYLGATTRCLLALEDGTILKVDSDETVPPVGATVRCLLPADALIKLDA